LPYRAARSMAVRPLSSSLSGFAAAHSDTSVAPPTVDRQKRCYGNGTSPLQRRLGTVFATRSCCPQKRLHVVAPTQAPDGLAPSSTNRRTSTTVHAQRHARPRKHDGTHARPQFCTHSVRQLSRSRPVAAVLAAAHALAPAHPQCD
jgi:hypothetical protein